MDEFEGDVHERKGSTCNFHQKRRDQMIVAVKDVTIKESDLGKKNGNRSLYKITLDRMPSHNCQTSTDMLKTLLILTVSFRNDAWLWLNMIAVLCELCCDHHYPGIACCVLSCLWIS